MRTLSGQDRSVKWVRLRILTWGIVYLIFCVCSDGTFAQTPPGPEQEVLPTTKFSAARALENSLIEAIEKAENSVVAIARGQRGAAPKLQDPQFIPHEYCAGVVVDANGLILTNYHSLGKVAENEYVIWAQGRAYADVKIRAADPWTDMAVLEIKARNLSPIEFGTAAGLKKGRIVISLGNPYAIARDGDASATWGIVSSLSRKIDGPLQGAAGPDTVDPRSRETLYHYGGLIQTDAKLAKNTSGGPLLDLDGKMIGLSTSIAILAGFEKGTGYAIPVNDRFQRVLQKLKRGEEIENGFLGVAPRNPDASRGELGVVLERIEPGTPAALDGLMTSSEVIRIDDHQVRTIDDLFFKIGSLPPGHTAQVTVRESQGPFRLQAREVTKAVRLTKKPSSASRPIIATAAKPHWRGLQVDYGTALSLKRISSLDPNGCVIVTDVTNDSVAWKAGLRIGTVISRVAGMAIASPAEFYAAVSDDSDAISFTLFDQPIHRDIMIPPEN